VPPLGEEETWLTTAEREWTTNTARTAAGNLVAVARALVEPSLTPQKNTAPANRGPRGRNEGQARRACLRAS